MKKHYVAEARREGRRFSTDGAFVKRVFGGPLGREKAKLENFAPEGDKGEEKGKIKLAREEERGGMGGEGGKI